MLWRKISLALATLRLFDLAAAFSNKAVFEAQFLNVTEELKFADEKYGGYEIIEHREDDRVWYNVSISREEISPFSWKELKTGKELDMNTGGSDGEHIFEEVKLSFAFPFFGTEVDTLTVSSAGAVLIGDSDHDDGGMILPSHVAAFLTSMPRETKDTVEFADSSNSFTVEWIKHYLHDDHIRLRMQLTIYADGSMTFLYQNLLPQLLQMAEDGGYPVVIGIQEGFAKPDDVDRLMHAYLYPGVVLDPTALASNDSSLKLTPVRHSGCANRMDEGACMEAADRCEWWCGSKCVYSFETERLGHCGDQGDRSGTPDTCDDTCPAKFDPACGTDKITYANECLLKMVACRTGKDVAVSHPGPCAAVARERGCPTMCPLIWKPVCGSDGVTYDSECRLQYASCVSADKITLNHGGKCRDDNQSKEYDYDVEKTEGDDDDAEEERNTHEDDPCDLKCNSTTMLVCQRDVLVFGNRCLMEQLACKDNTTIADGDWKEGPCLAGEARDWENPAAEEDHSEDDGVVCPDKGCPRSYDPVCATNGLTYNNECYLRAVVCANKLEGVKMKREGRCDEDDGGTTTPTWTTRALPRSAPENCALSAAVTAGEVIINHEKDGSSDLINEKQGNYGNMCLFAAASKCDPQLALKHMGLCGTQQIKQVHRDAEMAEEQAARRTSRAMKGLYLLVGGVAIAFLSVGTLQIYKRTCMKNPLPSQGHRAGDPVSATHEMADAHRGASPRAPETAAAPAPVHSDTIRSLSAGVAYGRAASAVSGAFRGRKYDKLPLVPNMEEGPPSDDDGNPPVTDVTGQFSV